MGAAIVGFRIIRLLPTRYPCCRSVKAMSSGLAWVSRSWDCHGLLAVGNGGDAATEADPSTSTSSRFTAEERGGCGGRSAQKQGKEEGEAEGEAAKDQHVLLPRVIRLHQAVMRFPQNRWPWWRGRCRGRPPPCCGRPGNGRTVHRGLRRRCQGNVLRRPLPRGRRRSRSCGIRSGAFADRFRFSRGGAVSVDTTSTATSAVSAAEGCSTGCSSCSPQVRWAE